MTRYRIEIWTRATKEAPARMTRTLPLEVSEFAPAGYAADLVRRMAEITGLDWRMTEESDNAGGT